VASRFLLDTHILVRWLRTPRKLSRDQSKVIRESVRRHEPLAISAMTLVELALLFGEGTARRQAPVLDLLRELELDPGIVILPIASGIAAEIASLGRFIGDPGDRTIVCTARVHRLQLLTSDQRIFASALVPTIE
jgi:PIN domain nuclease of toxin-antitoxin system